MTVRATLDGRDVLAARDRGRIGRYEERMLRHFERFAEVASGERIDRRRRNQNQSDHTRR